MNTGRHTYGIFSSTSGLFRGLLMMLFASANPTMEAASQTLYLGVTGGGSDYRGELRDGTININGIRPAFGGGLLFVPMERFSVNAEFAMGTVGGSDRNNMYYFARRRNLHFDTRITEWSITGRVNLKVGNEAVAIPYLMSGLALFKVDPFTTGPEGQREYLYPLSTEGQGISGTGNPPHRSTNFSIPIGGGIELRLTRQMRLDLELASRKTFTDYIDDVGNSYPDGYTLLSERGLAAFELSYRGDELPGGDPSFPLAGTLRGNPRTKDWYSFIVLRLRYPIFSRSYRYDRINSIFKGSDWPYRN